MKKIIIIPCLVIILGLMLSHNLFYTGLSHATNKENSLAPQTKSDGSKWRLGYYESEEFITYSRTLVGIIQGLQERGWITDLQGFEQVSGSGDARAVWSYLARREVSPYLEFTADGFYNLKSGDLDSDVLVCLNNKHDLDAMIVMGTGAAIPLSQARHDTNIFVFAASNAVRSGIIDAVEDSGRDHVWAHMDPQRFERQLNVFYDILPFKKLGLVYEDSDLARVYSAIKEVETLAAARGFEIVRCYVDEPVGPEDYERYYRDVEQAYQQIAPRVDAMFVTIASLESHRLPRLLAPFYQYKVPVFSQLGQVEVEHGALMSVSVMDELNVGRFGADTIIKSFKGVKPRNLNQLFQSTPKIVFNVKAAQKIGYKIPFELIIVTDEVYREIPGLH